MSNLQEQSTIMYESTFVCPFSTFWARLPGRVLAYLPYFPSYSLHCFVAALYFPFYSLSPLFSIFTLSVCSISVLHFPYYSFSLFPISLSKLLDLSPLFSILLSQYVPSCFAILLYITISQFPYYSLRYSILLSI